MIIIYTTLSSGFNCVNQDFHLDMQLKIKFETVLAINHTIRRTCQPSEIVLLIEPTLESTHHTVDPGLELSKKSF